MNTASKIIIASLIMLGGSTQIAYAIGPPIHTTRWGSVFILAMLIGLIIYTATIKVRTKKQAQKTKKQKRLTLLYAVVVSVHMILFTYSNSYGARWSRFWALYGWQGAYVVPIITGVLFAKTGVFKPDTKKVKKVIAIIGRWILGVVICIAAIVITLVLIDTFPDVFIKEIGGGIQVFPV